MGAVDNIRAFMRDIRRHETKGMTTSNAYFTSDTDLTIAEKVDAKLARDIWQNTAKSYKLSASVVICAIKAVSDYVGSPNIVLEGPAKQQKMIKKHIKKQRATLHRKAFVEGNGFIWVNFDSKTNDLEYIYFGMDDVDKPYIDIDTKKLNAISFKQQIDFFDQYGHKVSTTRTMFFDDNKIITEYLGNVPPGKKTRDIFRHNLGILPIVYIYYGKGEDDLQGHGMIEPVEPYLASMHTIMENRIIEDRRSSRKKYIISGKDPMSWIENSCKMNGIDPSGGIPLEEMDVFFCTVGQSTEEKVSFLTPGQTAPDSIAILKLLFVNFMETLRVPEFVFPPKLGASFASVVPQVPTFIQLIQETQGSFSDIWQSFVDISSAVLSRATLSSPVTVKDEIKWKRIDLDSPELRSKVVNYMMSSMKIAKENGLMDDEEIRSYLDSYMTQLKEYKEWKKGRTEMLAAIEDVKKAFGATKEKSQEGDNLIDNENRNKED